MLRLQLYLMCLWESCKLKTFIYKLSMWAIWEKSIKDALKDDHPMNPFDYNRWREHAYLKKMEYYKKADACANRKYELRMQMLNLRKKR